MEYADGRVVYCIHNPTLNVSLLAIQNQPLMIHYLLFKMAVVTEYFDLSW